MTIDYTKFVVHCKKHLYDVYIGRPSVWGNPFGVAKDKTRAKVIVDTNEDAVACYEAWVLEQPDMIAKIKWELKNKTLGCWCAKTPCHGHVLARIANEESEEKNDKRVEVDV